MKIGTSFIRPIINKIIERMIVKKIGVNVEVDVSNAVVEFKDDKAYLDISIRANTSKDDLKKIVDTFV